MNWDEEYSIILVHSPGCNWSTPVTVPHLHFVHIHCTHTPENVHLSPRQRKEGSKKKRILDVFGNAMHAVCGQAQPSQRVLRAIELAGLHCPSGVFVVCCVWLGARLPSSRFSPKSLFTNRQCPLRAYSAVGTTTCEGQETPWDGYWRWSCR